MSVTIDIAPEELAEIRERTKAANDQAALCLAAREYLRMQRLRELKEISGKVDFEENWRELEDLELSRKR